MVLRCVSFQGHRCRAKGAEDDDELGELEDNDELELAEDSNELRQGELDYGSEPELDLDDEDSEPEQAELCTPGPEGFNFINGQLASVNCDEQLWEGGELPSAHQYDPSGSDVRRDLPSAHQYAPPTYAGTASSGKYRGPFRWDALSKERPRMASTVKSFMKAVQEHVHLAKGAQVVARLFDHEQYKKSYTIAMSVAKQGVSFRGSALSAAQLSAMFQQLPADNLKAMAERALLSYAVSRGLRVSMACTTLRSHVNTSRDGRGHHIIRVELDAHKGDMSGRGVNWAMPHRPGCVHAEKGGFASTPPTSGWCLPCDLLRYREELGDARPAKDPGTEFLLHKDKAPHAPQGPCTLASSNALFRRVLASAAVANPLLFPGGAQWGDVRQYHWHCLRHTAITLASSSGMPPIDICRIFCVTECTLATYTDHTQVATAMANGPSATSSAGAHERLTTCVHNAAAAAEQGADLALEALGVLCPANDTAAAWFVRLQPTALRAALVQLVSARMLTESDSELLLCAHKLAQGGETRALAAVAVVEPAQGPGAGQGSSAPG